jgi:GNAT superfamily N-acetyltransferase
MRHRRIQNPPSAAPSYGAPVTVEISVDPDLTPALRSEIVEVWVLATNAGGSVGFLAPTSAAVVRPSANLMFRAIAAGAQHILVAHDGDHLQGWVVIEMNAMPLVRHWAWFKRLMVLPSLQGRGVGRRLHAAAVKLALSLGLEQLYLTCRSATGLAEFYGHLGWEEVGVMPANLRLVDGSYRDEIYMRLVLKTG